MISLNEPQECGGIVVHVLAEGLLAQSGPDGPVDDHPRRLWKIGLAVAVCAVPSGRDRFRSL